MKSSLPFIALILLLVAGIVGFFFYGASSFYGASLQRERDIRVQTRGEVAYSIGVEPTANPYTHDRDRVI